MTQQVWGEEEEGRGSKAEVEGMLGDRYKVLQSVHCMKQRLHRAT
jgi:hypothetical protein